MKLTVIERPDSPQRRIGSFHIAAFDPGQTSGWATARFDDLLHTGLHELSQIEFAFGQLGPNPHHYELYELLNTLNTPSRFEPALASLEVVSESFQFRQHISPDHAKTGLVLTSVEYIGVIKLFCEENGIDLVEYNASAAKHFVPDSGPHANDKLRALGLYQKGMKHANDATRHLLRYLVIGKRIRAPITDKWVAM